MVLVGLLALFGAQEVRLKLAQHAEQSARQASQTSQDGWKTCRGTLAGQDAALAAQAARSAAALAASGKQVAAVTPRAQHFASQAEALRAYKPQGSDRCSMLEDAVREARERLQ